jgi:hypothetical protein
MQSRADRHRYRQPGTHARALMAALGGLFMLASYMLAMSIVPG